MEHHFCPLCASRETNLFCIRTDGGLGARDYFKCSLCHLVFLSPEDRLDAEEAKKRYDSHRNDPGDERYLNFLNRLAAPLCARLNAGASGLDFGCGPGPAMSSLFRAGGYGMEDYDPVYRSQTDLLSRPYDFVTCSEVIEHFYEPQREFVLLDGLLNQGSFLGIMTCILEEESAFDTWWYPRDPTHVSFYQKRTFEWIAAWRNWKIEFPAPNVAIFQK